MFAVIYQFKLKPHQEAVYQESWNIVVEYFSKYRGAIGSCLHKGKDGLWVAYSRWPDKATRDGSWPVQGLSDPQEDIPKKVRESIAIMQRIQKENQDLEQYDEIGLELIHDKL